LNRAVEPSAVRCAFVIPVLNEAARIEALLRSLAVEFPDCERIVVDGGSEDGSAALAAPLATRLLSSERGRAMQMNAGARATQAAFLLFLHADTRPLFDQAALMAAIQSDPVWGFCRVRLSGSHWLLRIIERMMHLRAGMSGVATGDQLHVVRREVFLGLGGYPPIPLMEDVAMSKRLRELAPPVPFDLPVVTSSRRWEQRGILRTMVLMWGLRALYALGVSPRRLWQYYYGS
jgi:rSAM/selenodomain-associated transferase 2